ncbi:hypothetical protein [Streptomyces sp. NPDC051211]|uniref:hypothetical protein n=1 Tax=Streptomyces sp. NPDC051211 TaxID=3154643 RepID=UPI00344D3FCB
MSRKEEHHDAVLAEILLSERVGTSHIRYVGDIISTRAQLSMGMIGSAGPDLDEYAEMVEKVLELEDAYRRAWKAVTSEADFKQAKLKLPELEDALRSAAEGLREIGARHGIEFGS